MQVGKKHVKDRKKLYENIRKSQKHQGKNLQGLTCGLCKSQKCKKFGKKISTKPAKTVNS